MCKRFIGHKHTQTHSTMSDTFDNPMRNLIQMGLTAQIFTLESNIELANNVFECKRLLDIVLAGSDIDTFRRILIDIISRALPHTHNVRCILQRPAVHITNIHPPFFVNSSQSTFRRKFNRNIIYY